MSMYSYRTPLLLLLMIMMTVVVVMMVMRSTGQVGKAHSYLRGCRLYFC